MFYLPKIQFQRLDGRFMDLLSLSLKKLFLILTNFDFDYYQYEAIHGDFPSCDKQWLVWTRSGARSGLTSTVEV